MRAGWQNEIDLACRAIGGTGLQPRVDRHYNHHKGSNDQHRHDDGQRLDQPQMPDNGRGLMDIGLINSRIEGRVLHEIAPRARRG